MQALPLDAAWHFRRTGIHIGDYTARHIAQCENPDHWTSGEWFLILGDLWADPSNAQPNGVMLIASADPMC